MHGSTLKNFIMENLKNWLDEIRIIEENVQVIFAEIRKY
jgi:hypothetical protein